MNFKEIIKMEKNLYFPTYKKYVRDFFINADDYQIWKFQVKLRKTEYHKEKRKYSFVHNFMYLISKRKKNKLGRKLGFDIPEGCFKEGLRIYHIGSITVNPNATIGKNCIIVGNVCIGNVNGKNIAPYIGDNCMLGWGAIVIGDIIISDECKIAAGAVVVKSINEKRVVVGGVPAKILK